MRFSNDLCFCSISSAAKLGESKKQRDTILVRADIVIDFDGIDAHTKQIHHET